MKKNIKNITLLLIILTMSISLFAQTATPPSNGDGSVSNPYQISTLNNLYWVSVTTSVWRKHFIQTNDIDASSTSTWNKGFGPIGNNNVKFTGTYDGGNFTISGLTINRGTTDRVGFFGYTRKAIIKNINLTNISINGNGQVGGLIGYTNSSTITNCSTSGSVYGNNQVGGIIGWTRRSAFENCNSSCNVEASSNTDSRAGGFVGKLTSGSTATNCYATGDVVVTNKRGGGFAGLISTSVNTSISSCYSRGNVSGATQIGGFIGLIEKKRPETNTTLKDCYCTGNVTRTSGSSVKIGAFVGECGSDVERCYTIGSVFYEQGGNPIDKGFSGGNLKNSDPIYTSNLFDEGLSNQTIALGAAAKTTAKMKTKVLYAAKGWNFKTIWNINDDSNDGYPFLMWQIIYWDGVVSNDWGNPNNWNGNTVPTIQNEVVIPQNAKGESIVVDITGSDYCKSLNIGDEVTITVKPGGTLNVTGTIANNSPETSEFVIQSNENSVGSLIHKSGSLKVRYEQFVSENGAMIGSPVTLEEGVSFSDIKTASGQSNMGIDVMNDMFMSWDENEVINGYTGIWTDLLTPVNGVYPMTTETFEEGKGYFISYRNRDETIVFEGNAYANNTSVATTYTSSSSNPGANFISNPFVATVAATDLANNSYNFLKDNLSHLQDDAAALYIWDPATSTYQIVNNTNGGDYLLNPGQSFLVMTKENASLSFKQNTRMERPNSKNLKSINNSRIAISVKNSNNESDATVIYFNDNMTNDVDAGYDARKMMNEKINIFTNAPSGEDIDFGVLALPTDYNALTIPVQMDVVEAGRHTITFSIDNINANSTYLKDKESGEMINLNRVSEVKVDLEAGLTDDRFELIIKSNSNIFTAASEQESTSLKGTIFNINADMVINLEEACQGDVTIYNLAGQTVYNETIAGEKNKTFNTNLPNGYYIVKVQNTQGENLTEKVFIK